MEGKNCLRRAVLVLGLAGGGAVGGLGCTEQPTPTPTPPQRPDNRLIVPTPIPQGLEGVTFPSTPAQKPEIVLPPGWKFFKSEDLFFRIAIPSSWVPIEDSSDVPKSTEPKIAERFLGDIVRGGGHNSLHISALRVRLSNDESEWTTLEDFIDVKPQRLKYQQKEEEIVNKGYWPRAIDGSRAWFFEIHNPSEKSLHTEVIFMKFGRLWTITYITPYENFSEYLEEKRKFGTLVDSFKSP